MSICLSDGALSNTFVKVPVLVHVPVCPKNFWVWHCAINKIKNTVPWTYLISELNGEEIVGSFYEKELLKTNQKEFRIAKNRKQKETNYMSNGKDMAIPLILGLIKSIL